MEYHYDYHNDRDGAQPPHQPNTPQRTPNPNGQSNDFGAWLLIGIMFLVAWPVGLILLIKKLTDNPKTKRAAANTAAQVRSRAQQTRTQAQQSAPQTAPSVQQARPAQPKKQSAVQKVTQTPQPSAGGAKALKIVGIVLAALGGAALLNVAANDLGYAIQYGEWWYFLRQLFYPVGLLSGGLSLLIGSAVMKRKMRRYAKYLACAGTRDTIPLAHLMKAAEVGEAKAERDLEAMVEKGMWGPDAYLDRGNDMLFRTQAAANAYFSAKRAGEQRQAAETAAQNADGYEGMLLAIRRANDRIDDEVLSAKIDRLETVTGQIFKVIQEQPAKKNQASTFLNYYLPTTQKLLDSYRKSGREVPFVDDIYASFPTNERDDCKKVLENLVSCGELVMLTPQLFYHKDIYEEVCALTRDFFEGHPAFTLAEYRDLLGTSRKYALAILEFFDKTKVTKMVGDHREVIGSL